MRDIQPILQDILAFRDEREWRQFHNPKDLAISISIEAAELLETFQWRGEDTTCEGREDRVREELADVLIYCLYLADAIGADPLEIISSKVETNRKKYPVDKARGTARKYSEL